MIVTSSEVKDFIPPKLHMLSDEELAKIQADKEAELQAEAAKIQAQAYLKRLSRAGIPYCFQVAEPYNPDNICDRFFNRLKKRSEASKTVEGLLGQEDRFEELREAQTALAKVCSCSTVIVGKTGTHKTHCASTIASQAVRKGMNVWMIATVDLLDTIKRTFDKNSSSQYEDILSRAEKVDLLILDDFGKEISSEWAVSSILFRILNNRYNALNDTIVTTQFLTGEDMKGHLSSRGTNQEAVSAVVRRLYEGALILDTAQNKVRTSHTRPTFSKPIQ